MPVEVIMPKVDMDMVTGTLATWHVAEGEAVGKGAPLFDIETDKAAMEVESPASGRLHFVTAAPGDVVPVGSAVAWIYAEGEPVGEAPNGKGVDAEPGAVSPAPAPAPEADAKVLLPADAAPVAPTGAGPAEEGAGLRATPAARALARRSGLALDAVAGSGPNGRVQRRDVDEALLRSAPAGAETMEARAPAEPTDGGTPPRTYASSSLAAPPASVRADELHVTRRKGNGTPLLLVHGFAADSTGWAPLERHLPRDLPLIRIDLPSHGRSPRRAVRGFRELAAMLVERFDRLDVERVHILGHSLGGALALSLGDIRPRQTASLTLIAPAGLGPEIDGAVLSGIARASRSESLAPWLKRLAGDPDAIGWDFVKAAMLARLDPALREAQGELAAALFPDGVQGFDLKAALGRVSAPAAIVWGRSDRIVPWNHALAAPGAVALHLLHEVGHIPHVERPDAVAAIVSRLTATVTDND